MKLASGYFLVIVATVTFAQPPDTDDNSSSTDAIELTIPEYCEKPDLAGEIPDGATSSERELLAVQAQIREFIRDMDD